VDDETLIRLIDRFLVYYLQTANPLERTARWLERMDGGIDQLRRVVVDDSLGIAAQLERDMDALVAGYACEWKEVVRDPERRRQFEERAAAAAPPIPFVRERGQKRPADWPDEAPLPPQPAVDESEGAWVRVASVADVPRDAGITIEHNGLRIAVFNFATRGEWWASQATCPHRKDDVLGRGLLGSEGDVPKVACPFHKKTFSLASGTGLSDPRYCIRIYPVEIRGDAVMVLLPALEEAPTTRREELACAPA
jgi:nitrite reductase (NADH) large subunit